MSLLPYHVNAIYLKLVNHTMPPYLEALALLCYIQQHAVSVLLGHVLCHINHMTVLSDKATVIL